MFTLAKLAVFLTVAVSVAAMPSHPARHAYNHREIAARVAHPEPAPVPEIAAREIPVKRVVRKKRARIGRCNSSSVLPSSTPVESTQPSPSLLGEDELRTHHEPTSTPLQGPEPSTSTPQPEPTTTPQQPEPTPQQPEPTTTPQQNPAPSPTPAADPAPPSDNGGGQVYTGQATFYSTGLGACGITNNDGEDIAAVSHSFFDSFPGYNGANPNNNPMCGKTAKVTLRGKTIFVKLTDRCEGCAYGDLDFSPHAYNQLADPAEGRVSGLSWQIVD